MTTAARPAPAASPPAQHHSRPDAGAPPGTTTAAGAVRLDVLTTGPHPLLCWPDAAPAEAESRLCARVACSPATAELREAVLLVEAAQMPGLRGCASAAALVAVRPAPGVALPSTVEGVPVLTPADPHASGERVALHVLERITTHLQARVRETERHLDLAAGALTSPDQEQGLEPLLARARRQAGPNTRVHLCEGRRRAWPSVLHEAGDAAEALVRGGSSRPGHLRYQVSGQHVLVWPVGPRPPHGLLVIHRPAPFTAHQLQDWQRYAQLATALLAAQYFRTREVQTRRAVMAARVSALHHLMTGQSHEGIRTLEPLAPGLVTAEGGHVAVVEIAAGEDRSAVAAEIETALEAASHTALPVVCPAEDRQIIILYSSLNPPPQLALAAVAQRHGRAVGISPPGPWHRTPQLWDQATRAVDTARLSGGIAVHDGTAHLPERLGHQARAWARRLLEPADAELLPICRDAVELGATGAAQLLGMHRSTTAIRLTELYTQLGMDREAPGHRVALTLALRLAALPPPPAGTQPADSAADILASTRACTWARDLLERLSPELLETLISWSRHRRNNSWAAGELGVSRNTVAHRMQRISALLHIPLTRDRPGAWYDTVCALHAAGHLTLPLPHI